MPDEISTTTRIITPDDPEWPTQLNDLHDPPKQLYARGPLFLSDAAQQSVSIVGARACTAYGAELSSELAAGLTYRGYTIVSGGAYGIDAAAHRAALAREGRTIAVLAGGADCPYPPGNTALFSRIAERGLLLSEYEDGVTVSRERFLARDRIIAALSQGTVVVEAALRSGSRFTAALAHGLGRRLMACPGPVTSAVSAGCHELITSRHAQLVTGVDDVVHALPFVMTGDAR